MVSVYWANLLTMLCYLAIILITCLTTATIALFCSVIFRKTSVSLMTSYLWIVLLFAVPLAVSSFSQTVFDANSPASELAEAGTFISPIGAAFSLPLEVGREASYDRPAQWTKFFSFLLFYATLNILMLGTMSWLFNARWRVAY